jgi:hypothetical protein
MPDLMFRYRAGAYFANIYAPDITLGMMTSEELSDLPPEPRIATGRVVEGNPTAKLANPYQDEPAADAPTDPQPTGEEPLSSPVEVSELTERQQLLATLRDWMEEHSIKTAKFAPLCREAGLLKSGVQLVDDTLPIADLREICANSLAILDGTYKAGGDS